MLEQKILAACMLSRDAYNCVAALNEDGDFTDQAAVVYQKISEFYDADHRAQQADKDIVLARVVATAPKHEEVFTNILNNLPSEVSVPNVRDVYLEQKQEAAGARLSSALLTGDRKKIQVAMDRFNAIKELEAAEDGDTGEFICTSLDDLLVSVKPENLLKVYPEALNTALDGGCPRGSHILIFAPPEVGKSLFAINMACGFMHTGRKVLYVGNEDPHSMMLLRFFSRLSGMNRHEILRDPQEAERRAVKNGYGNLVFASLSPGTLSDIRRLVSRHEPDVLVVDQVPNLYTKSASKVEKLEYLASEIRNITKANNMVGVSLAQAAESAQNKMYLELGDVYFSNVGVQAAVDVMIGLGADAQMLNSNQRMISLCKNKITGNHSPFPVSIDPLLSKVI